MTTVSKERDANLQLTPSQRVANGLVRWRWPLLILGLAAAALAYGPAQRLAFDRSVENMFAQDDPILIPYLQLKRIYGGNEIALAAYVDPELLTDVGMERLDHLTRQMEQVPGVKAVLSLTKTPFGTKLIDAPVLESMLVLFEGYTIGADRQTTAVVCMLVPEDQSDVSRGETVESLRALITAHDPSGVLTGEPVMVHEGFRYLEADGRLLGWVSTLLLMGTMILCFRSVRWVLVPIMVVNCTLLFTEGLLVVGKFRLSMVSSMLWAIITVIGVGMVVHVILRFRAERALGATPVEALRRTGGELLLPIMWTCLTDTGGFGSLLWASVGPVQDFGKMMTMGSLLALVSAACILPGMSVIGRIDPDPKRAWGEKGLDFGLHQAVKLVEFHPWFIGCMTVLIVGGSMLGYLWLDVETDFTKNFRESSPVVSSYRFVEANLGGAGVWDIFIPAPDPVDQAFLDRVRRLEQRLRDEIRVIDEQGRTVPGLTKLMSLTDCIDAKPLGAIGDAMPVQSLLQLFSQQMPSVWNALLATDPDNQNQKYMRIMLRARERQPSAEKNRLINQVKAISREEFPEAQVTGFFVLLTRLIDSMLRDQWVTFGIATLLIGGMMFLAFRSVVYAIVAMIPNLLPNLVVLGLMGWLNLRINMGAAMIAAVSMGLAVDSSVHYITEFRHLRRRGLGLHQAIDQVHQSVGRAVVFSTLALMVGFSALTLSQFVPLIYFGVLVNVSIFGGMLGNLFVLPLLLRLAVKIAD
jgi:predicted RND superfamily exporter protein